MAEGGDTPKNLGNSLASLGAAITSPAKLAFIGYVILAYADRISLYLEDRFPGHRGALLRACGAPRRLRPNSAQRVCQTPGAEGLSTGVPRERAASEA